MLHRDRASEAKRRVLLLAFACIAFCAIVAIGTSRYFGVSFGLAMLGAMVPSMAFCRSWSSCCGNDCRRE
jgi:uncharacterized membrane protein AbrB (regulator of aidB expression)